jgi:SAM-dependent methyltransferase
MVSTVEAFALLLVGLAVVAYFLFASFVFGAGYEPTRRAAVERMLERARVGPDDVVYDLGAGTGAIVFRAARERGARVVGVEVEPIRVLILRLRRALGGPRDRVEIRRGNLFQTDFREATVVTCFLWPAAMERLKPRLEAQLRPGARVVSHWHAIPGWTAEAFDRPTHVYLYRWPTPERVGFEPGLATAG